MQQTRAFSYVVFLSVLASVLLVIAVVLGVVLQTLLATQDQLTRDNMALSAKVSALATEVRALKIVAGSRKE